MGEVVLLRDYHLKKLTREAADLAGELVKFAKEGGPVVDGAHPIYPNGIDDIKNIQLLCPYCNMSKGAKHPVEWAQENGRLL